MKPGDDAKSSAARAAGGIPAGPPRRRISLLAYLDELETKARSWTDTEPLSTDVIGPKPMLALITKFREALALIGAGRALTAAELEPWLEKLLMIEVP